MTSWAQSRAQGAQALHVVHGAGHQVTWNDGKMEKIKVNFVDPSFNTEMADFYIWVFKIIQVECEAKINRGTL